MKLPVSVFVIARNEEARLARTLAAVAWADQIVLVDSGSTDRTREIARAAGAEVHERRWEGYGPQKAHAESLCRHAWRLNVDADEVVTPGLAAEIGALLAGNPAPGAFRIRILNVYPGRDRPRWLADDYNVVRLYHREVGRYRAHALFDRVETTVSPGQLRAPIHHFPLLSWAHFVEKENRYSSFAVESAEVRRRFGLLLRLPVEMPLAFLRFYLLRRHVTGGWRGFMFALTAAFARTLRIAKMLERAEEQCGERVSRGLSKLSQEAAGRCPQKDGVSANPAVDRTGGAA
jgi:glycosyltransferase involved in cell wall biosynthesis